MTGRDRIVAMVAGVVVVIGAFWMLALSPRRDQATHLAAQIATQRQQVATLSQLAARTPAGKGAASLNAAQLARLGQAVPADDQTASLLFQLQDAAGHAHVIFNSIQPSGANGAPAGNATAAAPPAAPPASGSTSTTATPPPDSSTPAAPGATPASSGVQLMALSLGFEGRYADLQRFLHRVQGFTSVHGQTIRVSGRLLSVDGVALTAGPKGFPDITATITATAYIAPAGPAGSAAGGAAPAATASAPAPAGSSAPPTTPAVVGGAG